MLGFEVNGVPVPQPRHRICLRGGKTRTYMAPRSHRIHGWRTRIALAARHHRPPEPWCGPVRVALAFRIPAPTLVVGKRREEGVSRRMWAMQRGDIDNYAKAVLDVLTQEGFWIDDSQVVVLQAAKVWVSNRKIAGCRVTVDFLCQEPEETYYEKSDE